jgi:hypothetical protein
LIRWQQPSRSRYSFVLLFNTSRLNRLVEFQTKKIMAGIDDMISVQQQNMESTTLERISKS